MSAGPPSASSEQSLDSSQSIEETLHYLDSLAGKTDQLGEFYPTSLALVGRIVESDWVCVWSGIVAGRPMPMWRDERGLSSRRTSQLVESTRFLLDSNSENQIAQFISRRDGASGNTLYVPICVGDRVVRILTLVFRSDVPADAVPGLLAFAGRYAEAAEKVEQKALATSTSRLQEQWLLYADCASAANKDVSFRELARELVEAGAAYVDCGRVALSRWRRGRCRLEAISGIEKFSKRADAIVALERLVTVVAKGKQPVHYPSSSDQYPPQIASALESYIDLSAAKSLAIVPLEASRLSGGRRRSLGAVTFEVFDGTPLQESSDQVFRFVALVESSMGRSERLLSIPMVNRLLHVSHNAGWFGLGWMVRRFIVLGLLVWGIFALMTYQAELTVKAQGELVPKTVRHVFAPADSIVRTVHVSHGQQVNQGDAFVTLYSPALSIRIEAVLGEIRVMSEQLANLKTESFGVAGGVDALQKRREISAEQLLLELQIDGLNKQLELLRQQEDALEVVAPTTGSVVTWDISKQLMARPVQTGDVIGSMADTSGEWMLRIKVPDHLAGHVNRYTSETEHLPSVSFILESEPEDVYTAVASQKSPSSQFDPVSNEPYVLIEADIEEQTLNDRRMGAAVRANLNCGKQPIYYVWFHQAYEELRRIFF